MCCKKTQLLFLGLAFLHAACLPSFAGQTQELITAKQVRALSPDQAKLELPVRVRGQVLVLSGWRNSFFFSDGSAGISIDRKDTMPELHSGDLVEVEGKSGPGAFAPVILSDRIRVIGREKIPPAPLRQYSDLAAGAEDSQWVQLRGVVRAAWIGQSWGRNVLFLDVGMGGGHVIARVRDFSLQDPSFLVDAEVRLSGVCGTNFNEQEQFVGLRLFVADMDAITIETAAPADPFMLPLVRLDSIMRFSPGRTMDHRQRVSGTVTYQKIGEGLYIQDGERGLFIQTAQRTLVSPGDRIEAVGFAGGGGYSPQLYGALFRVIGPGSPPPPILLRADQLISTNADGFLTSRYDGLLVSLHGRLLERSSGANREELVLGDSGKVFRSYLAEHEGTDVLPELRLGSEVQVTGVAVIVSDEGGEPRVIYLRLRTEQDIVLLRSPSWWDTRHSLYVLSLAVLAVIASLFMAAQLQRRVRHQAEVIQRLERVIDAREHGPKPIEAPLRRWAAVGFTVAILLSFFTGFLSWRAADQAEIGDFWIAHTNAVLDALGTTSAHLVEVETSGRAYALSGQSALLKRFEHGEKTLPQDFDTLNRLTSDNPGQRQRLVLLQQTAGEAAAFAARIVAKRKIGPYPAGADAVTMEWIISSVGGQLGEMRSEEIRLLKERTVRANGRRHLTDIIRTLGIILGIGFLSLAGIAIRREINLNAMARAQTGTLNAALNVKSAELNYELAQRNLIGQQLQNEKQRAEGANRAKSAFLAAMSHEIRTPMNAMLAMAEMLWHSHLVDEQKEYVKIFQRNGRSLMVLINDILDFSKIESGHLELEHTPFELKTLAEYAMELAAASAGAKNLRMSTSISSELPTAVAGDPGRLRQILINLLGNAVKFTSQGEVSLTITPAAADAGPDMIQFAVADTGIGIPPDRVATIFEEFTQADSSITRKYGGTGLGLSISRLLVERMQGRLWVTSIPRQGSTFCFTARLAATDFVPEAETVVYNSERSAAGEPPLRILIAEDKEDNRLVMMLFLRDTPYELTLVENGQEAVEHFEAESFDLILMDLQMPVLDGLSAVRQIRALETMRGLPPIPIVAVSADAGAEDAARCKAAGCTDHLAKPISMPRLLAMIRSCREPSGASVATEDEPPPAGMLDALKDLVPGYLAGRREDADAILRLVNQGDFIRIMALAHQLKGSGSTYGFPGLTKLAAALEAAAILEDSAEVNLQAQKIVGFIAKALEGVHV